jgi:hypothetical protein
MREVVCGGGSDTFQFGTDDERVAVPCLGGLHLHRVVSARGSGGGSGDTPGRWHSWALLAAGWLAGTATRREAR